MENEAPDLLERVARGIWLGSPGAARLPWDGLSADEQDRLFHQARLAIAAMRDPSDAMDEAGQAVLEDPEIVDGGGMVAIVDGDAAAVWQAMIDAALAA